MKHWNFIFHSLGAIRIALLVCCAVMCFSAVASDSGHQSHDRDTTQSEVFSCIHETMPLFPGGEAALMKYLEENIVYPPQAAKDSVQGKVIVKFLIDKSGNIDSIEVVRSVREDLDAEAVRVIKTLPKFVPGRHLGKAVAVWYTLPVTFVLADKVVSAEPKDVEVKAMFPGGENALVQFFKDNIKYPARAAKKRIQGRVKLEFLIDKTGKVRNIKVVDSLDKDLDREAVRVCKLLPDFIPASVNGEPVEVCYTIPIKFNIPSVKHQFARTIDIDLKQ